MMMTVNNHVKTYQSSIEKYTTLETAKYTKSTLTVLFGERVTKGSKW